MEPVFDADYGIHGGGFEGTLADSVGGSWVCAADCVFKRGRADAGAGYGSRKRDGDSESDGCAFKRLDGAFVCGEPADWRCRNAVWIGRCDVLYEGVVVAGSGRISDECSGAQR